MKILIIDTCYGSFLETAYARRPNLAERLYEEQWRSLMSECFACADFYSTSLKKQGCEAEEIVANCRPLQLQWARQHGVRTRDAKWRFRLRGRCIPWLGRSASDAWVYEVLAAQVDRLSPDVVLVQDMGFVAPRFLKVIRPKVRLVVGQIACPFDENANFGVYDIVFSSIPAYVDFFRLRGLRSERLNLAFAPQVLPFLPPHPAPHYDSVFVGGLSEAHGGRRSMLESVAATCRLDIWGYGAWSLPAASVLRGRHHGEIWGLDMYQVLRRSRVVLNNHGEIAGNDANNMRLYETTGVGAFLLTDSKRNLHELFEPGKEVAIYASPGECAEMVHHYLTHEDERLRIARAGEARTLRDHTYDRRAEEFLGLIRKSL